MNDKQWVMFFDLLKLVVHLPECKGAEKAKLIIQKARASGAGDDLETFLGWQFLTD